MKKFILFFMVFGVLLFGNTDFHRLSTKKLLSMRDSVKPREIKAYSIELRARLRALTPTQRKKLMSRYKASIHKGKKSNNSVWNALNGNQGKFGSGGDNRGNSDGAGHGAGSSGGNGGGGGGHGGR